MTGGWSPALNEGAIAHETARNLPQISFPTGAITLDLFSCSFHYKWEMTWPLPGVSQVGP